MEYKIFDLGLTDFQDSRAFQKKVLRMVENNDLKKALMICRHNPVITLGRSARINNIRVPLQDLKNRGIQLCRVERGGDITYHGPGQLTAYPVVNLKYFKKDIHFFLRKLEEMIIAFLSDFGIKGQRQQGLTGVWIGRQKIASIGIAIKKWITFHGLSINIEKSDLINFSLIRPCGMDIEMTSLETVLGRKVGFAKVKDALAARFRDTFTGNQFADAPLQLASTSSCRLSAH